MEQPETNERVLSDIAKAELSDLGRTGAGAGAEPWRKFERELVRNVKVTVKVSLGSCETTIGELFSMKTGAVVALDKSIGDPVELFVDGELIATYRKQRLVMFGEYVPLSRWLPFLKSFTQVYGEFKPGKAPVTFVIPDLGVKTSVLICFEDVFPEFSPPPYNQQKLPDLGLKKNDHSEYPHAHELTENGAKQFHLCCMHDQIYQVECKDAKEYINRYTASYKLIYLIKKNANEGHVNEINPTNFQEPYFDKKYHPLQMYTTTYDL